MTYYRHKPTVVDAFKWTGDEHQTEDPVWIVEAIREGRVTFLSTGSGLPIYMEIATPEGRMLAKEGDWIVRGIEGEIYPVMPSVFNASYEPIEEQH